MTIPPGSPKRQLRNLLLEPRFQLKFTGYVLGGALVVALLLGAFLVRSAQAVLHEAQAAVDARAQAAETSRALSSAALNNELLQRLTDPAFAAQLEKKAQEIDAAFEREKASIEAQRHELVRRQHLTWLALGACLAGFLVLAAAASIVASHRVAGPLYRLRLLVEQVEGGALVPPSNGLRDGDELQDLFEAGRRMVLTLRERQETDAKLLEAALAEAESARGLSEHARARLVELLERMRTRLAA